MQSTKRFSLVSLFTRQFPSVHEIATTKSGSQWLPPVFTNQINIWTPRWTFRKMRGFHMQIGLCKWLQKSRKSKLFHTIMTSATHWNPETKGKQRQRCGIKQQRTNRYKLYTQRALKIERRGAASVAAAAAAAGKGAVSQRHLPAASETTYRPLGSKTCTASAICRFRRQRTIQ